MLNRIAICLVTLFCVHLNAMAGNDFRVYDGLLYKGKPDLTPLGIQPVTIVYSGRMWDKGESRDVLHEDKARALFTKVITRDEPVILDVEAWRISGVSDEAAQANIAKYLRTLAIAREVAPKAQIGFYGLVPERQYWPLVRNFPDKLRAWQHANQSLSFIADKVDALYPSIYTFYDKPDDWEIYAEKMLKQARTYNKPVYAFIWPQFHDSNKKLAGHYISAEFWARELEVCRKYADGVVIWGGWQQQWDENAPWWITTKAFMEKLKKEQEQPATQPAAP